MSLRHSLINFTFSQVIISFSNKILDTFRYLIISYFVHNLIFTMAHLFRIIDSVKSLFELKSATSIDF